MIKINENFSYEEIPSLELIVLMTKDGVAFMTLMYCPSSPDVVIKEVVRIATEANEESNQLTLK